MNLGEEWLAAKAQHGARKRDQVAAQAALSELRHLRSLVGAAFDVHPREVMGDRVVCGWCRDSSEEPWEWPCPTAAALGVDQGDAVTASPGRGVGGPAEPGPGWDLAVDTIRLALDDLNVHWLGAPLSVARALYAAGFLNDTSTKEI